MRVLQRGYELIWREDRVEDALSGLGEDFEWIAPDHPDGMVHRGPAAAIDFFHDWRGQFEGLEVSWELEDIGGGRVLALTSTTGRGRASGAPVAMRFAQVWRFRDGRFTRMVMADTPLLAIIREAGQTLGQEGYESTVAAYTEDVLWEDDPDWPDGAVRHGHAGVRSGYAQLFDFASVSVHFEETVERAGRVMALQRWEAVGLGSGAPTVLRPGTLFEFEGYLVRRVRFFLDHDRARRAFEAE